MGAQQSKTRSLKLDNDDRSNVIKVSDDVVQRLRRVEAGSLVPSDHIYQHAHGSIPQQPPPYYHYEPSMTSLQIRQETTEKLKKNDEYWIKRIQQVEKNNEKMKRLMDEEYKKAITEIGDDTKMVNPFKDIPCLNNRKKVMECYQQYANEPMRCAKEVLAFAACVDTKSVKVVKNRA